MSEDQLVLVYCFVDEFVKMVMLSPIGEKIMAIYEGKRGPKRRLALQEVITLNIMRFYHKTIDLKAFHRLIVTHYRPYFPGIPNYENYLKASNNSLPCLVLFVQYLLLLNRKSLHKHVYFMDSTPLSVCDNHYIASHKVAKGFATRGKTSKGWFYGFKLHGTCDEMGNLLQIAFSTGSAHDNLMVNDITDDLEGLFVADAGYLLRKEAFESLYEKHRRILAAARKNMKRIMTSEDGALFHKRSIIETGWDVLKERFEIVYHLARSMNGLFRHYLYSIISYLFRPLIKSASSLSLPPPLLT